MSTQYGTLSHRKTVQVPLWLIVALVVGMLTIGIGYTVEQYQSQGAVPTSTVKDVTGTQVAAGGAAAAQEANAGTVFPGGLETSGVIPATAEAPAAIVPAGSETSDVIPKTAEANGGAPQRRI
jgi:hypothetical protein